MRRRAVLVTLLVFALMAFAMPAAGGFDGVLEAPSEIEVYHFGCGIQVFIRGDPIGCRYSPDEHTHFSTIDGKEGVVWQLDCGTMIAIQGEVIDCYE